jgi:hypothetical protein
LSLGIFVVLPRLARLSSGLNMRTAFPRSSSVGLSSSKTVPRFHSITVPTSCNIDWTRRPVNRSRTRARKRACLPRYPAPATRLGHGRLPAQATAQGRRPRRGRQRPSLPSSIAFMPIMNTMRHTCIRSERRSGSSSATGHARPRSRACPAAGRRGTRDMVDKPYLRVRAREIRSSDRMPMLGPASLTRRQSPRHSRARLCLAEIDRPMEENLPDGRAPMAEHPTLQNWVRHMETRQSFQVTKPPPF